MQNAMRERQMSMQLAGAREMFYWLASFYGIATVGMLVGYVHLLTVDFFLKEAVWHYILFRKTKD